MNYYIFRITNNEHRSKVIKSVENDKVLRQGWGMTGFSLNNTLDEFKKSWYNVWPSSDLKVIKSKFNNLSIMKQMNQGDIIVIPKFPDHNQFSIYEVSQTYTFDKENHFYHEWLIDDFRHCIRVKELKKGINYYNNTDQVNQIKQSFRAYQKSINNIRNERIIEAIKEVIISDEVNKNISILSAIGIEKSESYSKLCDEIIQTVTHWSPDKLENIIQEIFKKDGYFLESKHNYDGKGGDIDLVFSMIYGNVLDDIMGFSDNDWNQEIVIPKIYVQAKNKRGNDYDVRNGIDQLIKMKTDEDNAICILMNTTKEIKKEDIKHADDNNVILLYGSSFAKFLMKYSLVF